jgi:regulatory protein
MEITSTEIRRAAMDLLARREHGRDELAAKLHRRFAGNADLVEAELDKLQAEGLQSDVRLAESFIVSCAGRGQGPIKIKSELRSRGVPDDVLRASLEGCGIDWLELAASVCKKRFGETSPANAKEKAKRFRFLQQRGFSFDHISSIL